MYVYMYFYINLFLLQHAPLHCTILHAEFVLVHGYVVFYISGFLILDVLAFALRPFHFSFSKSIDLASVVNCFKYFILIHISALANLFLSMCRLLVFPFLCQEFHSFI